MPYEVRSTIQISTTPHCKTGVRESLDDLDAVLIVSPYQVQTSNLSPTLANMSEKDPRAIFPGEKHSGFTICSQCLSIPFDKLPAEQEAAYPHYPSLTDLKASARTCPLCALLDQALTEETQRLNDEKHQTGIVLGDFAATLGEELPNPVIGYVESLKQWQKLRLRPDKKTLEVRDFGRWPAATFEDVELAKYGFVAGNPVKLPPQILGAGKSHADSELGIRPWVYGNWWLLDQPDESQGRTIKKDYYRLQLIGIGVRLTEMPTPHACKTYDRDVVHLRGSSLRVFTEFGLWPFFSYLRTKYTDDSLRRSGYALHSWQNSGNVQRKPEVWRSDTVLDSLL